MPIAYDASLRHYRGGHVGLVTEALEQPLLLPKDMVAYRNFNHPELFLSFKRDLAMVGYLTHCSTLILLHGRLNTVFLLSFFISRSHNKFLWLRSG